MRLRKPSRTAGIAIAALVACALIGAGVAYALTAASFESRATAWQAATCKESLLTAKVTAANNQKIALCYALAKTQEQGASIANLQAAVTALETQGHSADHTFFNGSLTFSPEAAGGVAYSPVFDARNYTGLVVTSTCSKEYASYTAYIATVQLTYEYSPDQATWFEQTESACGWSGHVVATAGRYYRVKATRLEQPSSGTVCGPQANETCLPFHTFSAVTLGHFTN